MTLVCMNCSQPDGHTNAGGLFCHDCRADLSSEQMDLAIDAYLCRMQLRRDAFQMWEQAA